MTDEQRDILYGGTCTVTAKPEPLTVDKLQEAIDLMKTINGEPILQFMLEKGFNPDDGDVIIFPEAVREHTGGVQPDYVKFSPIVDNVYLMRKPIY